MTQVSSQSESSQEPIKVFISYAEKDQRFADQLMKQLKFLERRKIIRIWENREISPGAEWRREIESRINSSQLILLLISPDFLASDYIYDTEIEQAMKRLERGEARIIPIILRPVVLGDTPFGYLQALPRNGRPVTTFMDTDEAFYEITIEIQLICEDLLKQNARLAAPGVLPPSSLGQVKTPPEWQPRGPLPGGSVGEKAAKQYQLYEVFVRSNIPSVTFVERPDFQRLKLYLQEPNRGVVLEGPSGIGKTTALRKALEALGLQVVDDPFVSAESDTLKEKSAKDVFIFNARNTKHQQKLATLRHWHQGMIVIDDFHYLSPSLHQDTVNYLKELADGILRTKKLVLVGIPYTGQTLVNTAFDVATRIDVLGFGLVKDELVLRMIEAGEKALNIIFDRKSEIAIASMGSLNIAQYLCYNICADAGIAKTQEYQRIVSCDVVTEIEAMKNVLDNKFGDAVKWLAAKGGPRDVTSLKLLEELSNNEDGILSLHMLKVTKPELAHGIALFINSKWMEMLYHEYPDSKRFLFYNSSIHTLIIDDPQFTFYLKKLSFTVLKREVGKLADRIAKKVFVSYSHQDADWLRKLQVYLAPVVRDGTIDLWDDEKIIIGSRWRDEIQKAIESSTVAILVVGPYFMASEFISAYELPQILAKASEGGTTVVSLIVDYCQFDGSGLEDFQTVNPPSEPLIALSPADQSKTLAKLVTMIKNKLV